VGEKPEIIKTHLRNMIVVPEMIGSQVGVYNGKTFNSVEIKVSHEHISKLREQTLTRLHSLKWLVTTWESFLFHTNLSSTVDPVLVLPTPLASFL
jgi:hypothetical protein